MSSKTMPDIADLMSEIDFCMLQTHTDGSAIAARPMSNNGDVRYDGDSHFFTWNHSRMVRDLLADDRATLTFQGKGGFSGLMGAPGVMIAVQGRGAVIDDKAMFAAHWNPDLERWFQQGIDTPDMVMLRISATRIDYWDGEENGTLHP